METNPARGHLAALLTIVIWGTTFISTKVLLVDFQPVEILFIRFMMGFLALLAVCPRRLQGVTRRQEGLFALAGLCGVCLYYLLENIALTYTMASNVGVIISVSPCFTALLTHFLMRGEERLRPTFFAGFAVAMAGICLISFNGSALELDLRGDLLRVGLLRPLVPEDQRPGPSHCPDHAANLFLRAGIHAAGADGLWRPAGAHATHSPGEPGESAVSGAGGLGPVLRHLELRGEGTGGLRRLLCHLEFCHQDPGTHQDHGVHLSGAGDHSGGLRADPAGTLHLDDRSRYGTDPDRAASL